MTANELARIEKQQRRLNKDIARLQRELMTSPDVYDVQAKAAQLFVVSAHVITKCSCTVQRLRFSSSASQFFISER